MCAHKIFYYTQKHGNLHIIPLVSEETRALLDGGKNTTILQNFDSFMSHQKLLINAFKLSNFKHHVLHFCSNKVNIHIVWQSHHLLKL